jgi:hypothetical protein
MGVLALSDLSNRQQTFFNTARAGLSCRAVLLGGNT